MVCCVEGFEEGDDGLMPFVGCGGRGGGRGDERLRREGEEGEMI